MAPTIDDRWLWLGLGVFFFLAAKGIKYAIGDVVRLIELDPYQYEPKKGGKEEKLEDAISLETLKTLAESPNSNIANSATSLVVSRFARNPTAYQSLLTDRNSPDETIRLKAKQALAFLREWPTPTDLDAPALPCTPPTLPSQGTEAERSSRFVSHASDDGVEDGEQPDVIVPSPASPVAGWTNVPRERSSVEDAALGRAEARRRRREAMVFHDGEGRAGEDIIVWSG